MARYEAISGTTMQLQIIKPELDEVPITTADVATWEVLSSAGVTMSNGTLSYTADLPVTNKPGWFGNFTVPDDRHTYLLRYLLEKSGARWRGRDSIVAKDW